MVLSWAANSNVTSPAEFHSRRHFPAALASTPASGDQVPRKSFWRETPTAFAIRIAASTEIFFPRSTRLMDTGESFAFSARGAPHRAAAGSVDPKLKIRRMANQPLERRLMRNPLHHPFNANNSAYPTICRNHRIILPNHKRALADCRNSGGLWLGGGVALRLRSAKRCSPPSAPLSPPASHRPKPDVYFLRATRRIST